MCEGNASLLCIVAILTDVAEVMHVQVATWAEVWHLPELLAVLVGKCGHCIAEVPVIHPLVLKGKGICSHHPLQSVLVCPLLQS